MQVSGDRIVFGPFSLEIANTRLLREGAQLELRPQAFHALKALILNSGRHVDYDQMIAEAWRGISVSKHTVAVTVGEAKEALKEYGSWISYRPKLGYRLEVPPSEDLIRKGWHFWSRSTREGFEKALSCFQQAARENDSDFGAFRGISLCYLMLGAYGMKPPREMYAGFLDAHERAAGLRTLTPELRADRAHAIHIFERRFEDAEAELHQALREEPQFIQACMSLAMLYATSHRFEEALAVLDRARSADPLLPSLPVTELFVRFCSGGFECAVASGKVALDLHPYIPLARALYAQALQYAGRIEEALAQCRLARVISPDLLWLRAQEGVCLAHLRRWDEAENALDDLARTRLTEYVDGYEMALLLEALGRRDEAFEELERAYDEGSAMLFMLDVDPKMNPLRRDRRFRCLRAKVFRWSEPALVLQED